MDSDLLPGIRTIVDHELIECLCNLTSSSGSSFHESCIEFHLKQPSILISLIWFGIPFYNVEYCLN